MLCDLPGPAVPDPVISLLFGDRCDRVAEGVYDTHLNFGQTIRHLTRDDRRYRLTGLERVPTYGVCDNWEQVIAVWPEIQSSPERFCLLLTAIRRDEQPAYGGWRWHKWGEYIGVQNPTHEYLYDDKHIDSVFVFSIVELR